MTPTRRRFIGTALLGLAAIARAPALATTFVAEDGPIRGYDPVAYFTEGAPVKGSPDYTVEHAGATWRFASAGNAALFAADPERYAPQYGGHCAYAMSKGALAPVDPEAWRLVDGKLYLNFSKTVQSIWSEDVPGNITLADGNWPRFR